MVKIIESSSFAKRGVDVMDFQQMQRAKPEDYMVAHMLGAMPREWRRRMYFSMLKQALWARNDTLAEHALGKCLMFVKKQRQTTQESVEGLLEPMWTVEKELAAQKLSYRALRLFRYVLSSPGMYKEDVDERTHYNKTYVVGLPKTWNLAVGETVGLLRSHSEQDYRRIPLDSKLVVEGYSLVLDVYLQDVQRKALGLGRHSSGITLVRSPSKDVVEALRQSVSMMQLPHIVYFLKTFPHMPAEFLQIFRIAYARNGGAFDLAAPPIKK